jgi:hypothetical protein
MAIVQIQTVSFRQELPQAVHNLLTDTLKLALYTSTASINADTTVYTTVDETSGTGYTAGGKVVTGATIANSNGVVYVNFDDVIWTPASLTAAGALLYNASKGNKSIAVLSFGASKTAVNNFTVTMPSNTYTSALLRFTSPSN